MRYADDFVVMCATPGQAQAALEVARSVLASMGLELHPDKTKVVDLREGREGFDFLGCHFGARMSGRLWEQRGIVRFYLHRWPSQRAMKRLREKVRDRTGANRNGTRVERVIEDLARRPERLHVIATGRNAAPQLIEAADLVTEMKEIKHPFHQGILAQRGIDY